MKIPILTNLYKKIERDPILVFPVFSSFGSIILAIILQLLNSLPVILLIGLGFLLAFSMIIYQIMSCNLRIKEISSQKEHYRELKRQYTQGKISKDAFIEKMGLLEKYEDN